MNSSIMCLLFLFVFLLFVFHYHLKEVAPKWYGLHFHLTTEQPLHFWEKTQILWGLHCKLVWSHHYILLSHSYLYYVPTYWGQPEHTQSPGFSISNFLFFFYSTGTFLDAMLLHLAQIIRVTQGAWDIIFKYKLSAIESRISWRCVYTGPGSFK